MNELVSLKGNDIFTDSLVIANGTGIAHRRIKDAIRKHKNAIEKFGLLGSHQTESTGGRPEELITLNEQQATFLITLLKNTEVVVNFKVELVRQFYAMRKFILEKQSKEWIATRYQGKLTRKSETDVLKQLVEYAEEQGSEHPDKYYILYSKLANKIAGIENRDEATISQLNNLSLVENIILHCIKNGIITDKHYKEIYQDCKKRLEMFKDLAYLEYTA